MEHRGQMRTTIRNSRRTCMIIVVTALFAVACAAEIEVVPENKPLSPESLEWIEQLQAVEAQDRWEAAKALGDQGPEVELAAPALITALASEEVAGVRWGIVWALGRIGPAAPGVVDTLAAALSDPDDHIRHEAATALGTMGPAARSALPALEAARGDRNSAVEEAVQLALESVG